MEKEEVMEERKSRKLGRSRKDEEREGSIEGKWN